MSGKAAGRVRGAGGSPVGGQRPGFTLDLARCVGCGACVLACRIENGTPLDAGWRRVLPFNLARRPQGPTYFFSLACHHCEDPPCARACPSAALRKGPDGIVFLDEALCLGCRYCEMACPFEAPAFDSVRGVMTKCHLCRHRLRKGSDPACVAACPTSALGFTASLGIGGLRREEGEGHPRVREEPAPGARSPAPGRLEHAVRTLPGTAAPEEGLPPDRVPGFGRSWEADPSLRLRSPGGAIRRERFAALIARAHGQGPGPAAPVEEGVLPSPAVPVATRRREEAEPRSPAVPIATRRPEEAEPRSPAVPVATRRREEAERPSAAAPEPSGSSGAVPKGKRFHELPLVIFTALATAAAGAAAMAPLLAWRYSMPGAWDPRATAVVVALLLGAGMAASVGHLGRPLRGPLALRGLLRSPLSDEVALAGALFVLALAGALRFPSAAPGLLEGPGLPAGPGLVPAPQAPELLASAAGPHSLYFLGALGVLGLLLLETLGRVYRLRGQLAWRGVVAVQPLLSGLLFGALLGLALPGVFRAGGPAARGGELALLVLVLLLLDGALAAHRWRALERGRREGEPVHPSLFQARRLWLTVRFLAGVAAPAAAVAAQLPGLALLLRSGDLLFDRLLFYGLALRATPAAAVREAEGLLGSGGG